MTETVITFALVAGIVLLWERWEQRRGIDEEHAARQGDYGWRLAKLIGLAVVLLPAALVLEAFDVPGAAVTTLVVLGALVVLIYAAPLLGPRKRRP